MNRITNSLIICFFTLLAINGNAQEKFTTYDNTNNGKKYDILVSVKGNAIFSLWINAMSFDELYQTGGIIIRERNYYKFLDDIEQAKQQYEELVKTAKTERVKSFDKMMRINSKADAYFKSGNWNLQYDVPLNFEFKVKESHGELNYLLFISTGGLTASNNSSVKSAGYGLVFSSTEEIDRFTQQISSEKIYDFVARIDTGFVAKRRNIARSRYLNKPRSGLFSKITVGVKAGYTTLFGGSLSSGNPSAYSLYSGVCDLSNGFNAGVFGRIGFKKFYFQPEFLYSMGQKEYTLSFLDDHLQLVKFNKEVNVSTIDIPLLLGYNLLDLKKADLRVFAGPKLRLNAGSSVDYLYFHTLGNVSSSDLITDIKATRLGFDAGLEFDILMFTIDARYNLIQDMYPTKLYSHTIDNISANGLVISLGWKLLLPTK